MAEHKHGSMEIRDHEQTFNGFMTFVTRVSIILLVMLALMVVFIR